MNPQIGGRILPFPPGTYQYDTDVYRGARRRPWFIIRIGQNSLELNRNTFPKFVEKVQKHFMNRGFLLDSEFLECRPDLDESYECLEEARRLLPDILKLRNKKYEPGIMSVLIGLVVLDFHESPEADSVLEYYETEANNCYFDAKDIVNAIVKSDFSEILEHCDKFIDTIVENENIPQSLAVKKEPKSLSEFGSNSVQIPSTSRQQPRMNDQYSNHRNSTRPNFNNRQPDYRAPPPQQYSLSRPVLVAVPPGLGPPGLAKRPQGFRAQTPPPGLRIAAPPGLQRRNAIDDFDDSESDVEEVPQPPPPPQQALQLCSIDDIQVALKYVKDIHNIGELLRTDSDLAIKIAATKLFNRFDVIFETARDNFEFLVVVNYASSSTIPEARRFIEQIMSTCFRHRYPRRVVNNFIKPCAIHGTWDLYSAQLVFELTYLFGYLCRLRPTINENIIQCWREFWNVFNETDPREILRVCSDVYPEDYEYQQDFCRRINNHIDKDRPTPRRNERSPEQSDNARTRSSERGKYSDDSYDDEPIYGSRRDEVESYERERDQRRGEVNDYERHRRNDDRQYYREQDNGRYSDERHERDETPYRSYSSSYSSNGNQQNYGGNRNIETNQEGSSTQQQPLREPAPIEEDDMEVTSQPYKFSENVRKFCDQPEDSIVLLWKKCEKIEPPNDFREMSVLPELKDYFEPEEPYLRRIRDDGIYENLQHYLDVQYRLMREDLISPLRDGIDIYRRNGSTRANRIPNIMNSDLTIYRVDRIEGKQASERDGFEMRYCHLSSQTLIHMRSEGKSFRGGNLVLLSCDGFEKDMHLACLQDFKEERGAVSIIILEEMTNRRIETNKPYLMAEATSYLPAYQYVLENMQKISKFAPIPFQRYLLHRKIDFFRPAYQRQEKTENQLKYETKMENHFNEVRSEVVKKRMIDGRKVERKKKMKKSKKSKQKANWDDNFSDDDFRQESEDSESCDSDSELYWLSKPVFKKPIGFLSAEDGDRMRINGKWYSISRLLSEFMPDNMDDSQRVAFCNSFQREFSIIQGPPGTGKTHIGVEIVKAMLKNRQHWRMTEPILIVCYTNSAIDQFLERIFMMISGDEELSKDDGKPKIIRFGSKSDSQIIAKNRLLREHVMVDYRTSSAVDQTLVTEMNSAYKDRNNRQTELATSSYGLYASRKGLLSFGILNRVMLPEFQKELRDWAVTHTDTKNMALSTDEALACWLLDTEFGRSKNPLKTASKFSNLVVEETLANSFDDDVDLENEDLTNEEILNKMFEKININCNSSDLNDARFDECENDGFHSDSPWDIAINKARNVVLLNNRTKIVANNEYPIDKEIVERIREEEALILKTPPMKNEEVADVKFIFSLTRPKRWALYQYWCKVLRKTLCEIIPRYMEMYKMACSKVKKCVDKVDASVSKSSMIVGCTTSGCSKLRSMLERVKPKILIVEEAAEVLESHILSAMISSIEHVVMIGDHQQLRPNPAVHELGTEYGLQVSMFERLVERGLPFSQLKEQHRMNTNIADLIVRPSFYSNVHDSENVKNYPPVEGFAENLYFWSHRGREQSNDGSSWFNLGEVDMVCALVQHLLKQSYTPDDLTVITTYSAQKLEILRRFQNVLGGSIEEPRVPVETVDSFQGQENKIVIVSLVRSHRGQPENTGIGFLAVKNRICVALTRAKYGMYIIGNGAYIGNNAKLWSNIVDSLNSRSLIDYHINLKCTAHGKIERIECPQDFVTYSPEGGCSQICDIQKLCGHNCRKRCHPNVESIHLQPCYYECQKLCQKNHPCKKKCYEECGKCMEYVEMKLKCGHSIITPCFNSESAVCDQRCSIQIDCGHQCANKCGVDCTDEQECKEMINHNLKCGHVQKIECAKYVEGCEMECVERCNQKMLGCDHQCQNMCGKPCPIQCEHLVEVGLSCGHQIQMKCYQVGRDGEIDEDLYKCSTLVKKTLEPCRHEVYVKCGDEAKTEFCNALCRKMLDGCGHECGDTCSKCFTTGQHHCQTRCSKVLECGHMCTSKCGETCPPCQSFCDTSCSHMNCGIANNGYGRECRKLCVLCTNNCQNKCAHRSCDRKCFEECSVAVCNEKCKMALKCGHGCLGMCGEVCPNVCGTCNRKGYDEVVNVMGKENVRIYRLVQLQHCSHVFPVEYLDEYVEKRKAECAKLLCPRDGCNKQFGDVWRYAKYSKKLVLEKNRLKFRKSIKNGSYDAKFDEAKRLIENSVKYMHNIQNDMAGTTKAVKAICTNFMNFTLSTFPVLAVKRGTTLETVEFYRQVARCVDGMAYIYHSVLYVRINKSKVKYPPTTEQFILDVFADTDLFSRQMRSLDELLNELVKVVPSEFVGAVIPKVRYSLARINCVLQLMILCRQLLTEQNDMTTMFANSLKSACLDLFKQNEKIDLTARIEDIEKLIIGEYPGVAKSISFRKWVNFGIPEF